MSDRPREVRVLVCGNVDRRDDGAAVWAAASVLPSLRDEGNRGVVIRRCRQLEIEDLVEGDGGPVVVIDAAVGIEPGRIVTMPFDALLARTHGPAPHSSHSLPIDQVIGVARALSDVPVDGVFVGIGGQDFGHGPTLSPPVRAALSEFVKAIDAAIGSVGAAATVASGR